MRAYRLLLRLYPASFRNEYGADMAALVAERLRVADGPVDRIAVWLDAIRDLVTTATLAHWDLFRADLRHTARTLGRSPGFAITALAIVALGVAATTAAFSVADFVLLRPLPFPDGDRLVKVWERPTGYSRMELSPANYRDWKAAATVFDGWGAFNENSMNLVGTGEPQRIAVATVTADLFSVLGAQALVGRRFAASDDRDGAPGTVLLSYRLWQTTFGGDPGVIGRRVTLDDEPFEVIGVMPAAFRFPTADVLAWTTFRFGPDAYADRTNTYLQTVARLRPGVSLRTARGEIAVLAARSRQQYPKDNAEIDASVFRLRDEVSQQSLLLLVALSGAAACVLLIACANLASLLLTRALARGRELAVRAALGAGTERLVRQLLTETLLLTGAGIVAGIALAAAAVPLLATLVPSNLPIAQTPTLDLRAMAVSVAIALATGAAFGLAPLRRIAAGGDLRALHEGARAGGGAKELARSALVVTEVAASIVLLVTAGLLLRALWTVERIDPGFRTAGTLMLRTALPMPQYGPVARREAFYAGVLDGVRALPGVADAAYVSFAPLTFRGGVWPVSIDGRPVQPTANQTAVLRYATPRLFSSLAIPILAGRDLAAADDRTRPFVAVVSASFVRRYFPGRNPIGQHFTYAFADREIVGVVGDIRARGLERVSEPQVYLSSRQVDDGAITFYAPRDLIVRMHAGLGPGSVVPAIRALIRRADPELPVSDVRPLADLVAGETASRSVQLRVIVLFAGLALLLAAVGLHGVLSFAVAQRTHEIGVRVALGARPADIVAMVVGRSALLAAAGTVPGLALAYAAGRWMEALLAGVRPADAATLGSVVGLAAAMTLAGSLSATVRALRIDPIAAVRAD